MSVDLLLSLAACQHRISHVHNDAFVSVFEVVLLVARLVLSTDEL